MSINLESKEDQNFTRWISGIGKDGENVAINVSQKLGDIAKKKAEEELLKLKRSGKLPKYRNKHMYQDVVKRTSKKYGYISIGGGKDTATLWHLVNDGTFHASSKKTKAFSTSATHFMDKVLNDLDAIEEKVWDDEIDD